MYSLKLVFALILLAFIPNQNKQKTGFRPDQKDEVLKYEMHWAFFKTGEAELCLYKSNLNNRAVFHAVASRNTTGLANWFLDIHDYHESYFDPISGRPFKAIHHVNDGSQNSKYKEVSFNQTDKTYKEVSGKPQKIGKNQFDIISAFYALRRINLSKSKIGDTLRVATVFDGFRYTLQLKYVGIELLETILGEVKTIKLAALDAKSVVFPSEKNVTIWITSDNRHIPVKASFAAFLGSATCELSQFDDGKINIQEKRLADKEK